MTATEQVTPLKRERKPTSEPAAAHVFRAMNAITAALASEGIGKTRQNEQQRYKFRGIDEVLNTLARLLADEKLVVVPHMRERVQEERQTKSGGALFSVTISADYTFVSAEDGSSFSVGPFYGEAMDSADKATNKAMSAAYKYMAIQTFCIPTEGDNDADATTHEVAPRAAGGHPTQTPTRQQQPVSSAQAKRDDAWGRFERTLQSFRDVDELEGWWRDGDTQAKIEQMPKAWQEQAAEAYEKRQEALLQAGRP